MTTDFDPYHKWLGIGPEEQPANHYRLLGVKLLEADADVIENAADQRMSFLRGYQNGANAAHSQRLLNELSAAKLVLLTPDQKQAYDQHLRANLLAQRKAAQAAAAQALPRAIPVEPAASVSPAAAVTPGPVIQTPARLGAIARRRGRSGSSRWLCWALPPWRSW